MIYLANRMTKSETEQFNALNDRVTELEGMVSRLLLGIPNQTPNQNGQMWTRDMNGNIYYTCLSCQSMVRSGDYHMCSGTGYQGGGLGGIAGSATMNGGGAGGYTTTIGGAELQPGINPNTYINNWGSSVQQSAQGLQAAINKHVHDANNAANLQQQTPPFVPQSNIQICPNCQTSYIGSHSCKTSWNPFKSKSP